MRQRKTISILQKSQEEKIVRNLQESQQEEKKETAERTSDIKQNIIDTGKALDKFVGDFNRDKIFALFTKSPESLLINDEFEALEFKIKSFNKHINDIKSYIDSLMHPDIGKYKDWNIDQMCQWISLLENGRFKPYLVTLRNGFINDGICQILKQMI